MEHIHTKMSDGNDFEQIKMKNEANETSSNTSDDLVLLSSSSLSSPHCSAAGRSEPEKKESNVHNTISTDKIEEIEIYNKKISDILKDLKDVSVQYKRDLPSTGKNKIRILEQQLREAVSANKQWQKFYEKNQTELAALKDKIAHLDSQLTEKSGLINEDQQKEIDKLLLTSKKRIDEVQDEKESVEDELRMTKVRKYHLETELDIVKENLRTAEVEICNLKVANRDNERSQILEMQLEQYKLDFETERRDRERAQTTIEELRRQMRALQVENHRLTRSVQDRHYSGYDRLPGQPRYGRNYAGNYNFYDAVVDSACEGVDEMDGCSTFGSDETK